MPLKLLKKEEINEAQARDKSREIAEGLKLSRKVDDLRKIKVEEEVNLEKFRNESLRAIGEEIQKANAEKEIILGELQNIREERDKGLSDVIQREESVSKREKEVGGREEIVSQKEIEVEKDKKETHENLIQSYAELEISQLKVKEAENNRQETQELHKDAEYDRMVAENTRTQAWKLKERIDKELDDREDEIEGKELVLLNRENKIKDEEEAIRLEKIRLADQRQVLEVEFKWVMDEKRKLNGSNTTRTADEG